MRHMTPIDVCILNIHTRVETGTIGTPVLGFVENDVDLSRVSCNHDEVDQVFIRSMDDLMNPELQYVFSAYSRDNFHLTFNVLTHRQTEILRGREMPVFLGGVARIWGLTAYILRHTIHHAILPSDSKPHSP